MIGTEVGETLNLRSMGVVDKPNYSVYATTIRTLLPQGRGGR